MGASAASNGAAAQASAAKNSSMIGASRVQIGLDAASGARRITTRALTISTRANTAAPVPPSAPKARSCANSIPAMARLANRLRNAAWTIDPRPSDRHGASDGASIGARSRLPPAAAILA